MAAPYDALLRAHLPFSVYLWYVDNALGVDALVQRVLGFCRWTATASGRSFNEEHLVVDTVRYVHACQETTLVACPVASDGP